VSTIGITSSLLSQIVSSSSTENQFATDLNQLAQDLQTGKLASAQQDFVTLSQDALNGATSATATTTTSGITTGVLSNIASSSDTASAFVSELNQLGTDLGNNDLSSAQGDMLTLSATALGVASSASTTPTSGSSTATSPATAGQTTAAIQTDIHALIQAMSAGLTSAANTEMAQLASDAGNSTGASSLAMLAGASSSSGSTVSSTVTQMLQSLDSSPSTLDALA